jgi:hypothetical protein
MCSCPGTVFVDEAEACGRDSEAIAHGRGDSGRPVCASGKRILYNQRPWGENKHLNHACVTHKQQNIKRKTKTIPEFAFQIAPFDPQDCGAFSLPCEILSETDQQS